MLSAGNLNTAALTLFLAQRLSVGPTLPWLVDYSSSELGPAFQDDRLITIEIGRTASGATVVNYQPIVWKPDTAMAA